jgi:two-component system chemotaxis sensor kinase CheA
MIRGLARTTKKEVDLSVENGSAELDKTVAEKLVPALLHLIRNAVDHGIEMPEQRRAQGKPPRGKVKVHCSTHGGRSVEICISDDGRGVDRAALAARAGVTTPLDDAALLDVICRPGLSTRSEADSLSGRGMGMDIVRKIVTEELRGELVLDTSRPPGTMFILRVPLSIAIIDGFAVVNALRESSTLARVPLLVYSALDVGTLDQARLRLGPTEFLTKSRCSLADFERHLVRLLDAVPGAPLEDDDAA